MVCIMSCTKRAFVLLTRRLSTFVVYRSVSKLPAEMIRRSQRVAARNDALLRKRFSTTSPNMMRVEHDNNKSEFYIDIGNNRAYLSYEQEGDGMKLLHTEVPAELEGRGLGKILAKEALEHAIKNNFQLQIECDFIRHYISKYEPTYLKYIKE